MKNYIMILDYIILFYTVLFYTILYYIIKVYSICANQPPRSLGRNLGPSLLEAHAEVLQLTRRAAHLSRLK